MVFLATLAVSVSLLVYHFGSGWNISTPIGWIIMNFCRYIHSTQRIRPTDSGDLPNFLLVPPWGWNFSFLVKCLNNYWMHCHKYSVHIFRVPSGGIPSDFGDYLAFLSSALINLTFRFLQYFSLWSNTCRKSCVVDTHIQNKKAGVGPNN